MEVFPLRPRENKSDLPLFVHSHSLRQCSSGREGHDWLGVAAHEEVGP